MLLFLFLVRSRKGQSEPVLWPNVKPFVVRLDQGKGEKRLKGDRDRGNFESETRERVMIAEEPWGIRSARLPLSSITPTLYPLGPDRLGRPTAHRLEESALFCSRYYPLFPLRPLSLVLP
uniref:Secreted protein n=1 Tax=Bursaphelenchus xylophilus TaxID=6326 RepID=A0A1I7STY0_BURXY